MKFPSSSVRITLYIGFFFLALLLMYVQYRNRPGTGPALPEFGVSPHFSLTAQDGRTFTHENLLGKVTIADFIFTSCAGPCPLMSASMQKMQSSLQDNKGVFLLSFSVDPETDTPGVLSEYARRFGADSTRWTFLTGSKSAIYDLTRNGFHLALEADSDAIAHSTKFVLIDKNARIRGYYDSGEDSTAQAILRDAVALTEE